jgi:uncharacterized Zn finger protein
MHDHTCPECLNPGSHLDKVSKSAYVEYYRCTACGHVWTYKKSNPDGPSHDVTESRRRPSQSPSARA